MVGDRTVTDRKLAGHLLTRVLVFLTIPLTLYISCFYVHLSLLYKAGPNDNIMTSAFQASLEVSSFSIHFTMRGQYKRMRNWIMMYGLFYFIIIINNVFFFSSFIGWLSFNNIQPACQDTPWVTDYPPPHTWPYLLDTFARRSLSCEVC